MMSHCPECPLWIGTVGQLAWHTKNCHVLRQIVVRKVINYDDIYLEDVISNSYAGGKYA